LPSSAVHAHRLREVIIIQRLSQQQT
jgi:hypothetical protein